MTGRGPLDARPGCSLPVFDRLAPAPPPALGRRPDRGAHRARRRRRRPVRPRRLGGRAALDRQRRAVSLESTPLTRMLAEVVLRPPDVRHLDAAFQGMAASPRRESSLKVSIGDLFATRCATCGRTLVVDEFIVGRSDDDGRRSPGRIAAGRPRHYRCTVCRDQRGGAEQRQAPLDADDLRRADGRRRRRAAMRSSLLARFPASTGAETLVDELLDLHTPRQLVGARRDPRAHRGRPAGGARSWPRSASRSSTRSCRRAASATGPGRRPTLRVVGGHVRLPTGHAVARAQPVARLRGCLPAGPRVRPAPRGRRARARPGPPRRGPAEPRRGRGDGRPRRSPARPACVGAARRPERLRPDGPDAAGPPGPRPAAAAPEPRPAGGRLPRDGLGPRARGGRAAAARRPRRRLAARAVELAGGRDRAGPSRRSSRRWPATAGSSSSSTAVRRRSWPPSLGGASAGYRLVAARLADPDDDAPGVVELVPPGGRLPPGPRTRANVGLEPLPGRGRRPGHRPGARPVRAAGALRPAAVLGGRGRPGRDRGRGRDAPGARRAGPLRAAARRDPRRARPGRAAAAARDGDAAADARRAAATTTTSPATATDGTVAADAEPATPPTGPAGRGRHAGDRAALPTRHAAAPRTATCRPTRSSACSR